MRRAIQVSGGVGLVITLAWFWLWFSPAPEAPALTGTLEVKQLAWGDVTRHFVVYRPASLPDSAPVLLVLHGTGQDGQAMRRSTAFEFEALADSHGFAVVYPDGIGRQWNDCRPKSKAAAAVDDVGFLLALINSEGTPGGKAAVFGYSNGGQMGLRLATEVPASISGVVMVGANHPTAEYFQCPPKGETPPMLVANGTADPIVPFEGGHVTLFHVIDRGYALSADETARTLAERNGLTDMTLDLPAPETRRRKWLRNGTIYVEQLVFEGAGHVIPQPKYRFPRLLGATPTTFDLPSEAVTFLGL